MFEKHLYCIAYSNRFETKRYDVYLHPMGIISLVGSYGFSAKLTGLRWVRRWKFDQISNSSQQSQTIVSQANSCIFSPVKNTLMLEKADIL